MKFNLLAGFLASILAVIMPFVLVGMGEGNIVLADTPVPIVTEEIGEVEALPQAERTVQAIVIHENSQEKGALDLALTVEVSGEMEEMNLEEYLVGVLMGEMPASFDLEALKAQAVAARTYTLHRLSQGGSLSDDPAVCQAYCDPNTAEEKWGDNWASYLEKLNQAVEETAGQVLVYEGKLISATYFACSGGRTESAQAVWGGEVPYLVSVDSPGEEEAAGYESVVHLSKEEFLEKLEIASTAVSSVIYTEGGGVDTITIDGKTFTGTEIRSLFGLRSTMFDLEVSEDWVTFYVQGYGHRVGMSQYGAQAMAVAGSSYEEILKWYYTGVEIVPYDQV